LMVVRRRQVQQQKEEQVEEVLEETQPEEAKEGEDLDQTESKNDDQNELNEGGENECENNIEKQNLESNNSKEENASETEANKSSPDDYQNDCAAVIQHLNKMRLTCGPLKLEEIHNPELISILENASNYQINMSSIQNKDDNGNIIGTDHISMLEISFF